MTFQDQMGGTIALQNAATYMPSIYMAKVERYIETTPLLLEKLCALERLIDSYDIDNVYNMDETGLFFRMVPRYTVLMPNEDASTVRGRRIQKERVTLSVCANATGTHKLPLQMIGKAKRPACIIGRRWPLPYCNQKKAWVDTTVFMKWFDETFCQEVWRRTRRPVLLLLDNAPGHTKEFIRANITVKFFPPNVTAWKQPMDMGIIAALKKRYKFLILADIIAFNDLPAGAKQSMQQAAQIMRPGAAGVKHGKPATLLDAAEYAIEA